MKKPLLSRRTFVERLAWGAAGTYIGLRGRPAAASSAPTVRLAGRRPNIILILADDLGFSDVGCYGAEIIETPNLDRLGYGGVRFTQFYNCAKCAPTRASLLTGLYSQQVGCHGPPIAWRNCVSIAEALQPAGYTSWLSGKWHEAGIPARRGFARSFALCDGECNYWNPGAPRDGEPAPAVYEPGVPSRWAIDEREFAEWTPDDPDFFTTDAFTDAAIRYVREGQGSDQPFFLHLAFNAPHFPLHAHPEDIAKYRGRFRAGWDELRARRHRRQVEMGLVDPRWKLLARDEEVPAWRDVADPEAFDLNMAVYAAMVDRMDRNIGRLLHALDETGQAGNTLVLFLSDNGSSAEQYDRTPDRAPGPIDSFRTLGRGWANLGNTPFRKFKQWDHEGGISTPLIAHWPGVLPAGRLIGDVGHVIDVMPTLLELAGAEYPREFAGASVQPCEGRSLVPLLEGRAREPHELLCWQFAQYAAARRGDWKAVRRARDEPWELYDMAADRTETRDLAAAEPARVASLAADFAAWSARVGGKP